MTLDMLSKSLEDKVDNTGNMKEWPSEQIMALYICQFPELQAQIQQAKTICELGAGKSGLVGFLAGKIAPQSAVYVTDGNASCV